MDPIICRVDVSAKNIATFRTSRMTTANWKNLIIDVRTDIGDSEGEDNDSNSKGALSDTQADEAVAALQPGVSAMVARNGPPSPRGSASSGGDEAEAEAA